MNATDTRTVALIEFAPGAIDSVVDELSARLDSWDFPVLEVDLEAGIVRVDASSDPDDYSVMMAAHEVAHAVGLSEEYDVFSAVLVTD